MKRLVFASFFAGALLIVVAATAAVTHNNNGKSGKANLDSFQEVPTLATTGRGSFRIRVRSDGLHYKLSYSGVESNVIQAHIHLGRTAVNGGIIAFLCGPQPQAGDKPVCPLREGTVEGVIDAADIGTGAAGQGIPAGDLADAIRSIRKGAVYANVHTTTFPGGEIRGQINSNKGHDNGRDKGDRDKR
jgi:CHRD domain-containing protein